MKIRLTTATACLLMAASSLAAAPLDDSINYQGRLTNSGSPVTGLADLTFSLWDSAIGGAQIDADIVLLNVPVADGLFNVDLDFGASAYAGNMRWLEIEARNPAGVGGYTLLTPRQELTSAPSALGLRLPLVQDGAAIFGDPVPNLVTLTNHDSGRPMQLIKDGNVFGSHALRIDCLNDNLTAALGIYATGETAGLYVGSEAFGISVDSHGDTLEAARITNNNALNAGPAMQVNNWGTGPTIQANAYNGGLALSAIGPVEIGDALTDGTLLLYNNGVVGIEASDYAPNGCQLFVNDELGTAYSVTQPDFDGTGGYFNIYRTDISSGFTVDGNYAGTESTRVSISGTSSMSFDTSTSGNFSVNVPVASISSAETSNEPGVASEASSSPVTLTGPADTILSRSISCPSAGFCVVIGTCQPIIDHTTGTSTWANFGVSDVSTSLPVNQDVAYWIDSALPSGTYESPVTVHGTFSVSSGLNTFYLLADHGSGVSPSDWAIWDNQLTVMFFPTAYGTVTPTIMGRHGEDDSVGVPMLPMSAHDIDAERLQAIQFDIQRTRAELEQEFARMDLLQQELEQIGRDQLDAGNAVPARRAAPPPRQAPLGAEQALVSPPAGPLAPANSRNSASGLNQE